MRTPHQPIFTRDGDHLLFEVALATSAAPTYFPIATMETFEGAQLIDGGMWANNPALLGIVEALKFYVGIDKEYERFKLLSIASIRSNIGWSVRKRKNLSGREWVLKLIDTTMDSQSQAVNNYIKHLIEALKGEYVRIESQGLSKEQLKHIHLDKAYPIAIKTIKGLAESEVHKWVSRDDIKQFFN
jgi:patatin-like phospholipase/acyl hydrolase